MQLFSLGNLSYSVRTTLIHMEFKGFTLVWIACQIVLDSSGFQFQFVLIKERLCLPSRSGTSPSLRTNIFCLIKLIKLHKEFRDHFNLRLNIFLELIFEKQKLLTISDFRKMIKSIMLR